MFRTIVKVTIYGAGILLVLLVVLLLLFLTFENAMRGEAIYGTRDSGAIQVSGPFSILVNLGIVGLVISFASYLLYLYSRKELFAKVYIVTPIVSGILITAGFVLGGA